MLSRWFDGSRALDHREPQVRLKFLTSLPAERAAALQDRLLAFLQREPDAQLRKAALAHLRNANALTLLLQGDGALRAEVAEHIASHLDPDADFCARYPDVARARLLVTDSADERATLLTGFEGVETLVELAVKAHGELRDALLALPALNVETAYGVMERSSRGHDKAVNRHARERIDAIRATDEALQSLRERAATINNAVGTLIRQQAASPAPSPALGESIRRQLLALRQELQGLIQREAEAVAQAGRLGAARTAAVDESAFDDLDLAPPAISPFTQMLASISAAESWSTDGSIEDARRAIGDLQQQWQSLATLTMAAAEETRRFAAIEEGYAALAGAFDRLAAANWPALPELPTSIPEVSTQDFWRTVGAAEGVLARHARVERDLAWPERFPTPRILHNARQAREIVSARIEAVRQQETAIVKELEGLLAEAARHVEDGQSRTASSLLTSARKQLALISPAHADTARQRLDSLSHRLGELKDWQTFATAPKREELLARMRELVGAGADPEALAQQIKRVRAQWNALGAPVSRHEHALRNEFEHVAAEAFEPCRLHFAEQERIRAENLDKRQALIGMLSDYIAATDWQNADFTAAEAILQTARQEWHACFPVPRGDHKSMVDAFESLQSRLHGLIQAHYQASSDRKQALIDRLRALRGSSSIDEQVEAVKDAQQAWKAVGPGLRQLEHKLWREFRELCDAVFADRATAAEASRNAHSALLTQASTLNAALAAAIDAFTVDNAGPQVLREARNRFAELGDLGRDGRSLAEAHHQLIRRGEAALGALAARRRMDRLERIRALDIALDQPDGEVDLEPRLRPLFAERVAGRANAQDDLRPLLADLALLGEIAAGLESPAEDRARRMGLQVELMNRRAPLPDAQALLNRWCALGGKPDEDWTATLRERFFGALRVLSERD